MNPLPLAITWAVGGVLAAIFLPHRRRRRLAALVPLAAAIVALLTLGGGADLSAIAAPGGLLLGRAAGGLALLCALATTVALVLAPPPDGGDIFVVGACGALAVLAMATGSPLVWGGCLVGGMVLLGIRWLAATPARSTLAAARIGTLGAAALVAAAPFLPVDVTSIAPRVHLVGALLALGITALLGLLPLGGWLTGSARVLRGAALVPWALLLMPALVVTTQSTQTVLPAGSRVVFGWLLLPVGVLTAAWAALNALLVSDAERYVRVLVADLGLVALGLASQENGARLGSLLLLLTHVCVAPLTLQEPSAVVARQRRLAWLALSGIPPSPAFWGRFALTTAVVAGYGGPPLLVTIPVAGVLVAVSIRAIAAAPSAVATIGTAATTRALRLAAWLPPVAALTLGMLPNTTLRALLGVG